MLAFLTRRPVCFNLFSRPNSLATITAAALLLIGLAATPSASHAAQSYDNCVGFITSLPFTITI